MKNPIDDALLPTANEHEDIYFRQTTSVASLLSEAMGIAILELQIFGTHADQLLYENILKQSEAQGIIRVVGDEIFYQFERLDDDDLETIAHHEMLFGTEAHTAAEAELVRRFPDRYPSDICGVRG